MTSLRTKILTSFGLSKIALLVFAVIVIADLMYLKNRILDGVTVNAFFVASQEIRRDEKNLFLYNNPTDYEQIMQQLDTIEQTFKDARQTLTEVASTRELVEIDTLLENYRDQLERYSDDASGDPGASQDVIRKSGQNLLAWAREFIKRERDNLVQTARGAAWILLIALLTVVMLGLVSAMVIIRQVVRPLGALESQLDEVADGGILKLALPSQDKEIQSVVLHFNDMLERLRAQQSKLRKHEKAAALGVLASGVAHELNNPLSNISTSVQLLIESDESTSQELRKQWMTHIDEETERARRIVRRLLDSVRQPKLHIKEYQIASLIDSSVALVSRQLPDSVQVHNSSIPDLKLHLDRERMQQVFINLIKNASDAGAQNIWIDAMESSWQESSPCSLDDVVGETEDVIEAPRILRVDITDDGPGIDEDNLANIFTPFFTTQSGRDGTGLGLYLVEEIISEHDACIAVENRTEGGTRFTIWFPLKGKQEAA
jgi:signal transduction histidine kinase